MEVGPARGAVEGRVTVSGYAKRMMEIASAWHQVNPDPGATLRVPLGGLARTLDKSKDISRVDALIGKARRAGRPDFLPQLERLRKSFEELHNDPALLKEMDDLRVAVNTPYRLSQNKLDRPVVEDDPIGYAVEAPWLLAWARDGYNTFDLSPDFVAAMLLTDPSEIDLPSLKLPFGGMLFMIPDRFAVGAEGLSYTKIHVVEIDDSRAIDGDGATLESVEKRPAIVIYATDGARILSTVAQRADLSWAALEELPDEVTHDVDKEARTTIQRVVLGALAYATAVDRAITERFPAPKKRREQPGLAHWTIGREIKISPSHVRRARGRERDRLPHQEPLHGARALPQPGARSGASAPHVEVDRAALARSRGGRAARAHLQAVTDGDRRQVMSDARPLSPASYNDRQRSSFLVGWKGWTAEIRQEIDLAIEAWRAKEKGNASACCLDCGTPLVPCDCRDGCAGGKCAVC